EIHTSAGWTHSARIPRSRRAPEEHHRADYPDIIHWRDAAEPSNEERGGGRILLGVPSVHHGKTADDEEQLNATRAGNHEQPERRAGVFRQAAVHHDDAQDRYGTQRVQVGQPSAIVHAPAPAADHRGPAWW